ncbi:DUF429 domain-containing protein, partial [bacterium]|nr:DUF429 domain-containing protein [bacterium]
MDADTSLWLTHTFLHIPGIGPIRDRLLREKGIHNWDDLEVSVLGPQLTLLEGSRSRIVRVLEDSREALSTRDADYFAARLPRSEHFRIALAFPADVLFLDIETTGLSRYYDRITLVGWDLKDSYQANYEATGWADLSVALAAARAVVTFNGSLFDLPFLRQELPQLRFPECHIDLRFAGRRVGLIGPQKEIERELGMARPSELAELRSRDAPVLWYRYQYGDLSALEMLIRYNYYDMAGMKRILDEVIDRTLRSSDTPTELRARRFYNGRQEPPRVSRVCRAEDAIWIRRPAASRKPEYSLHDLGVGSAITVVGIDLTGSEKKPSGWSVVHGSLARTKRLRTDDELVAATIEAQPQVVSVDSPLSLPAGRTRVDDDDPARNAAGIMRQCERVLKSRGINVYPCLIPSMQRLTARGIELAQRLRARGIPVIESFPGGAQDVLGIPRKRASRELLQNGLRRFGLGGDIARDDLSHDELDAVTCALVGLFFWAGRFEALGDDEEDFLILPDPTRDVSTWQGRLAIGISGPVAAGKTTAARCLEELGLAYGRYSLVLAELLSGEGVSVSRENLQRCGFEIYRDGRQRWLGCQLLKSFRDAERLAVDGLRHPEDHALLTERFGPAFLHLHVQAQYRERQRRSELQGTMTDEFENVIRHEVERNVDYLRSLAHVTVDNDAEKG